MKQSLLLTLSPAVHMDCCEFVRAINVPLILKVWDIFFSRAKRITGHFADERAAEREREKERKSETARARARAGKGKGKRKGQGKGQGK